MNKVDTLHSLQDTIIVNSVNNDNFIKSEYSTIISTSADFLTILTFFITIFTLVTVRKYKSKVIDRKIFEDNINHLKKYLKRFKKFENTHQEIASDSLQNLQMYVKKLKRYGSLLSKRKYKNEVKAILSYTELTHENIGSIISDTETILRIVENDQ